MFTKHTNICSELCTGWKPTNDICIDKIVPTQYKILYATYIRWENLPVTINANTCNGIKFIKNTYPPHDET